MTHAQLMQMPVDALRAAARTPFELHPDAPTLLSHFARSIVDEIRERNARNEPTRLILPVGPVHHYAEVAEISNRERVSWRNVHTFNMDEFLGWQGRPIPVDHPLSFEGFMKRELFAKLDEDLRIPEEQTHYPHPFRIDEISEKIREVGGIDVCYGGVGYHGHVAFNEPPLSRWHEISVEELRQSLTRVVMLGDDSIVVQSIHNSGGDSQSIPPMAVTLGMKDILSAKKIRLYLAAGERHRAIFRISVAGDVNVRYPATLVQGHPDAVILTTEPTAEPIHAKLM
ncbi:MAG: 6-phosphogluconolactonase [Bryobacterales bacterium]|nr:6-phosphogluconolactonase [Bryobacterales bacterium]